MLPSYILGGFGLKQPEKVCRQCGGVTYNVSPRFPRYTQEGGCLHVHVFYNGVAVQIATPFKATSLMEGNSAVPDFTSFGAVF